MPKTIAKKKTVPKGNANTSERIKRRSSSAPERHAFIFRYPSKDTFNVHVVRPGTEDVILRMYGFGTAQIAKKQLCEEVMGLTLIHFKRPKNGSAT